MLYTGKNNLWISEHYLMCNDRATSAWRFYKIRCGEGVPGTHIHAIPWHLWPHNSPKRMRLIIVWEHSATCTKHVPQILKPEQMSMLSTAIGHDVVKVNEYCYQRIVFFV